MRKAIAALAILAGALALLAVLRSLGPDSTALPPFSSDTGIPVLMINAPHWHLFHAFYYGQDRFGAWPFFAVHLVLSAMHRACTPELLAALLGIWVLSGAVAAAAIAPNLGGYAALAYLAAVLWPDVTFSLFDISQPYAWQIVALLWSWWALRRVADRRTLRWWFLGTLFAFLATWSSRLSGPMLLALVAVEVRSVGAATAVAAGIAGEAGLRTAWHHFVRAHYHHDYATNLAIDWGYLHEHAAVLLRRLTAWDVAAALVLLAAGTAWQLARRRENRTALPGALAMALAPLGALFLLHHFRENLFSDRYLVPTLVLGRFGALLAAGFFARALHDGALSLAAAGAATIVVAILPHAPPRGLLGSLRSTATALADRAPGSILLDGYWGAYALASLAPPGALLPLPKDGDYERMPFVEPAFAHASRVIVGHRDLLASAKPGDAPELYQYGALLEPVQPLFFANGTLWFSLYSVHPVAAARLVMQPAMLDIDLRNGGATFSAALPGAGWLAVQTACDSPPSPRIQFDSDVPAQLRLMGETLAIGPRAPVRRIRLDFPQAPCLLRHADWIATSSLPSSFR